MSKNFDKATHNDLIVQYYPLIRKEFISTWRIYAWVLRDCYVFADGRRVPTVAMRAVSTSLRAVQERARDPFAASRRSSQKLRHNKRVIDALTRKGAQS